jgi:hypothetical protein
MKIIKYVDIINIINFRLISKKFLTVCNYVLNKYISLNKLLYSRIVYGLNGGYIDTLFKIINIENKRLKVAPLTIIDKMLIKEKSKYNQKMPIYEKYDINYNTSLIKSNETFYIYKFISNGEIKFYVKNEKKNKYIHSIIEIWNSQNLSEVKYYE